MLYTSLFLAAATTALAVPMQKRANYDAPPGGDTTILNYALTLEYLERKFYQEGLSKYGETDFCEAGFSKDLYHNFVKIKEDEEDHVDFLAGALSDGAVGEPTFSFPYTDVKSFVTLSAILEGVGVSAYLGAAGAIANKAYIPVAGSILTVEARHVAIVRNALGHEPFPTAFDTPLNFNQVFSLAAQFITSLAPGTDLPFKAFPKLTAAPAEGSTFEAGKTTVLFKGAYASAKGSGMDVNADHIHAVFFSGLQTYYVKATVQGDDLTAVVPAGSDSQPAPAGQVYVVISLSDGGDGSKVSDENTLSGVGIIDVQ